MYLSIENSGCLVTNHNASLVPAKHCPPSAVMPIPVTASPLSCFFLLSCSINCIHCFGFLQFGESCFNFFKNGNLTFSNSRSIMSSIVRWASSKYVLLKKRIIKKLAYLVNAESNNRKIDLWPTSDKNDGHRGIATGIGGITVFGNLNPE